jgi:NTE family protein
MGVLRTLLPALSDEERPRIVVGTSVGAINTAYLAANAGMSPTQLGKGGVALWREIGYGQVLKPLLSVSEGVRLWSYLREVLGSRGAHTKSVLDPAPLSSTLRKLIPFERIHANVSAKHISTAAVVATSGRTNTSVVFHDGGRSPATDTRRGITYVKTELTEAHVLASAAIPLLFPAVPIEQPAGRRWYFDGGTRLNTPIKPALALGAERLIVIALNSLAPTPELHTERQPDALDGATQLIQGLLVDPLVNDVHTLATVNEMLGDDSEHQIHAHERRTGRKRVPYMLIAPKDPLEVGRIATEVYRQSYSSSLSLLRSPNLSGLGRLLNASSSPSHGEILSYLLFAEEFTQRLIEIGRRDAKHWLGDKGHDHGRWQLGPLG